MYVKQHKHLDKKIWTRNETLVPLVREMLLQIIWAYIDYIRCNGDIDIRNSDIKDIIVYGSITNYFYTKKSDIDLCIVFDKDTIQKRLLKEDLEKTLSFYKMNWKMGHRCLIYGRGIDISTENINCDKCGGLYRSGPIYSIMTNKWLRRPVTISRDDFRQICKNADKIYKQMKHGYDIVKKLGFHKMDILQLYNKIYDEKNAMHERDFTQPVTPIYLAFRKFRSRGYLDKLQIKSAIDQSKEFVLK